VANVVMMAALLEETECLLPATAIKVLEAKVKNPALLELDRKALDAGRAYIDHSVAVGAVTQADGFAE
jgi:Pyruvate/2-oxoacid:ferredoxin oxidoreductase gamma subunit